MNSSKLSQDCSIKSNNVPVTFDGSWQSWHQISCLLSSTAMTYHTGGDKPPYIELVDSGRIIDVGDEVSLEIVINPSIKSVQVDNTIYRVKPKEFLMVGYQCKHCCFENESVGFCNNFKCSSVETDDNRRYTYELISMEPTNEQ